MAKVGRNYKLDIITPAGKQITIEPPFTNIASITRNTLASANKGNFTLYNLGQNIRNQIYKDRYDLPTKWEIILYGGYGNRLHKLFEGNIFEAYSYKQNTEWITKIDCFDGIHAIQNGFMSETLQKETLMEDMILRTIKNFPGMIAGAMGAPAQTPPAPRGTVLMGQTSKVLSELTDDKYFIDLAVVNVLDPNEVISGAVIKLDSGDLLGTPRRRETLLEVPVLFEPQVQVGHVYEIESLEAKYNGQYGIQGFSHNVAFDYSGKGGQATTNLQLYFGADGLQEVTA